MEKRILANTYGTAFPMRMDFERQILSRYESFRTDVNGLL